MWCDRNTMGFFGWTMMILFWSALIAVIIWGFRALGTTRAPSNSDALAVLERRFATGEIDREEFEEKRQLLDRGH